MSKARETCQKVGAKIGDSSQSSGLSSHRKGEYFTHDEPRYWAKTYLCTHATPLRVGCAVVCDVLPTTTSVAI